VCCGRREMAAGQHSAGNRVRVAPIEPGHVAQRNGNYEAANVVTYLYLPTYCTYLTSGPHFLKLEIIGNCVGVGSWYGLIAFDTAATTNSCNNGEVVGHAKMPRDTPRDCTHYKTSVVSTHQPHTSSPLFHGRTESSPMDTKPLHLSYPFLFFPFFSCLYLANRCNACSSR